MSPAYLLQGPSLQPSQLLVQFTELLGQLTYTPTQRVLFRQLLRDLLLGTVPGTVGLRTCQGHRHDTMQLTQTYMDIHGHRYDWGIPDMDMAGAQHRQDTDSGYPCGCTGRPGTV